MDATIRPDCTPLSLSRLPSFKRLLDEIRASFPVGGMNQLLKETKWLSLNASG
jgi:hypothetical protein